uniref:Uncharacterized protein n=1 Tax=Ignisphaera aggregans TaxID=334771 RepID=A0A7C2V912_9CREN
MVNNVYFIERFVYLAAHEKYEPPEEEIVAAARILGLHTKKLGVVLERYKHVFSRYVEKRCTDVDNVSVCIYVWNRRVPFKAFPLSMHLTGTVLLFKDGEPQEVLAYPIPKALSYAKSSDVPEERYGSMVPVEATKRIDGWQVTAYYNPILGRWVWATRYALHNMYFEGRKIVVEPFDSLANPFVYVANRLADREGLYKLLDRFRGWTFTFVLQGPEPAITKPPYPLGEDYDKYTLYVVMARDPEGRLYTWKETSKLLGYRCPEPVEPKELALLYREVRRSISVRSYLAYIDVKDPENPLIIELESEVYPEAMYVKYLYDAKSAALLITDNLGDKLKHVVDPTVSRALDDMTHAINRLQNILSRIEEDKALESGWEIIRTLSEYRENISIRAEELAKAIREKNINRLTRKILGILLENLSLTSKNTIEILNSFVAKIEKRLGPTAESQSQS